MKYKFIGTDKDLCTDGFVFIFDYKIKAIKRANDSNDGNAFLNYENEILSFNKSLIQDLIDKGLVVEVEDAKN